MDWQWEYTKCSMVGSIHTESHDEAFHIYLLTPTIGATQMQQKNVWPNLLQSKYAQDKTRGTTPLMLHNFIQIVDCLLKDQPPLFQVLYLHNVCDYIAYHNMSFFSWYVLKGMLSVRTTSVVVVRATKQVHSFAYHTYFVYMYFTLTFVCVL